MASVHLLVLPGVEESTTVVCVCCICLIATLAESQISISFCGWFVLEEAPTLADTSKSTTTTPPPGSSESTAKVHPSSSTASCTRCATTALARSTQRPVSNPVAHTCIYMLLHYCVDRMVCPLLNNSIDVWPAERPPGYDRVRNAEIGNKDFELDVLEEAYTTEHWLVRIYKVPLFPCLFLVQCGASHDF